MKNYSLITNKNCVQNIERIWHAPEYIHAPCEFWRVFSNGRNWKKHALCPIQIYPYLKKHHSMNDVSCHILYVFNSKSYFSEAVVLIPTVTFQQPLFLFSIFRSILPLPLHTNFPFIFLGLMRVYFEKAYVPMYDC